MRIPSYLLIPILILFSSCGGQGVEVIDEEAGISVTFPDDPNFDETKTINGKKVRSIQLEKEHIYFTILIEYIEYEVNDETVKLLIDATHQAGLKKDVEVLKTEKATLDGQSAIYSEQKFSADEMTKSYIVLYGDKVVSLGVTAKDDYSYFEEDAEKFFNSLKRI